MLCKRPADSAKLSRTNSAPSKASAARDTAKDTEFKQPLPVTAPHSRKVSGLSTLSFDRDDLTAEDTKFIKRRRKLKSAIKRRGRPSAK